MSPALHMVMTRRNVAFGLLLLPVFCGAGCGSTPAPQPTPTPITGRWLGARPLLENAGNVLSARVQLNASGSGLAVWAANGRLAAARFDPPGDWTALPFPAVVAFHIGGFALNDRGEAVVTWRTPVGRTCCDATVWASHGTLEAGFGRAQRVDAGDPAAGFSNFGADVALDEAGNALLVWNAFPVFARRLEQGRFLGPPVVLSPGPSNAARVASAASGNAVLAWQEVQRGRVARFFPGSGFSIEEDYDGPNGAPPPTLALNRAGDGFIGGFHGGLWFRSVSTTTLGLGEKVFLSRRPVKAIDPIRLAVNRMGRAVALWHESSEDIADEEWASQFEESTGWQRSERVLGSGVHSLEVGLDNGGDILVAFTQQDQTRSVLKALRFVRGRGWGQPETIDIRGQSEFPSLSMDAGGSAVVVWTEFVSNGNYSIWVNRFDATAN